MSSRSRQAQRLARDLTLLADVLVQVIHQSGRQYLVQWGNGPTRNTMSEQVAEQLATGNYPDLSVETLRYARGYSARAFAARAVAAHRDGGLIAQSRLAYGSGIGSASLRRRGLTSALRNSPPISTSRASSTKPRTLATQTPRPTNLRSQP